MTDFHMPIAFLALRDDTVEHVGFAPTHRYVEDCWLPFIGATATLLLRHVGHRLGPDEPLRYDQRELAHVLGVRSPSKVRAALTRLERHHLGKWLSEPGPECLYGMWLAVPPLVWWRSRRLPATALAAHRHWTDERTAALAHAAAVAHP